MNEQGLQLKTAGDRVEKGKMKVVIVKKKENLNVCMMYVYFYGEWNNFHFGYEIHFKVLWNALFLVRL